LFQLHTLFESNISTLLQTKREKSIESVRLQIRIAAPIFQLADSTYTCSSWSYIIQNLRLPGDRPGCSQCDSGRDLCEFLALLWTCTRGNRVW